MKIAFFLSVLCLLTGCFSRSAAMTGDTYSMVELGTPVNGLSTEVGKPYAVHDKGDGTKEYEYIERIRVGRSLVTENHYYLIVQDGKVVGKRMSQQKPPAYNLIYQDDPNYESYNAFP